MTPSDIIAKVRPLIQDTRTPYRYSDTVLLQFVNQSLKRMAMLRPDLFTVFETIPTQPDTVIQQIPSNGLRLVEVYNVAGAGGTVITEVNKNALDQNYPGWRTAPSGVPVNYIRHVRNPSTFFLYPAPTAGIEIVVEYAKTPDDYTIDADIVGLSETYLPIVVDGTVFLAESVDNEHVNSNRAKLFQDSFNQSLAAGLQTRTLSDTDAGGLDPKQVV